MALTAASVAVLTSAAPVILAGGASAAVTSAGQTSQGHTALVIARIAPGGPVKDASGARWANDARYVSGGKVVRFHFSVPGTTNDALFQGERYGSFSYAIKVPTPGVYHVAVNEAESTFTMPKQRVFSITAEGVTKAANVDIVKAVGARFRPMTLSFDVTVKDGTLNLAFISKTNYARVSSVLVTRNSTLKTTTPVRKPTASTTAKSTKPAAPAARATVAPATTTPPPASSIYGSPVSGDPTAPLGGFFGPSSVFKADLTNAPVDSNSAALVNTLVSQVQAYYGGVAAFNVWQYNSSDYTVGASQAPVTLKWDDCQHKGNVPSSLFGPDGFMVNVPLPSDAVPSAGSDAAIGIYQPSSDTYWGFWKLNKQADGWHACWGGKIHNVSQSRGWYENGGGVSATGLADGGAVGIKEAQAGTINHAIAIGIPSPADYHRFSWPALRSDGSDYTANAIPEGTRFRLDPTLNLDSLGLTPLAKMVAKAAQKYGLIVTDKAGSVSVSTESGTAVAGVTGVNPWNALLAGKPSYLVMKNFPWAQLQAMPQNYGQS